MTFAKEVEMYPILQKWLETRKSDPCFQVLIDRYKFDTGQKFRADLVGVYLRENNHRFVGIEAKLHAPFSLKPLGQAQAMQTFCHEVYLALPNQVFSNLDDRKKESLQSMLSNQNMGLLLVNNRKPKVVEEVKCYPLTFRLDLYKDAVDFFSDVSEEEGREILSQFVSASGLKFSGWWHCIEHKEVTTLFNTDYKPGEGIDPTTDYHGKISLDDESITLSIDIVASGFMKTVFDLGKDRKEAHLTIGQHLKKLSVSQLDFTYMDKPWFLIDDTERVDLSLLTNQQFLYNISTVIATRDLPHVSISIEIERPVLLNVHGDVLIKGFIHNLIDAYTWLYDLANDLGAEYSTSR